MKKRYTMMVSKYNSLLNLKEFNNTYFEANIPAVKELKLLAEQLEIALTIELRMITVQKTHFKDIGKSSESICKLFCYEKAIRHELRCLLGEQPLLLSWKDIHVPFYIGFI